jgi:hypothetical protein
MFVLDSCADFPSQALKMICCNSSGCDWHYQEDFSPDVNSRLEFLTCHPAGMGWRRPHDLDPPAGVQPEITPHEEPDAAQRDVLSVFWFVCTLIAIWLQ